MPRRRSRAVDLAKVRDYVLLTIGATALTIDLIVFPLLGRSFDPNLLLRWGFEAWIAGLPVKLPGGLFSSDRHAGDEAQQPHAGS